MTAADLPAFGAFPCSDGKPFEDAVEQQIRDPLPLRYLASPPRFDGRMLIGADPEGRILAVGAHHIEPALVPDAARRPRAAGSRPDSPVAGSRCILPSAPISTFS